MQGASFWADRLQIPKVSVSKVIILNIVVFCVCPFILMLCIVVKLVSLGHSGNNIYIYIKINEEFKDIFVLYTVFLPHGFISNCVIPLFYLQYSNSIHSTL